MKPYLVLLMLLTTFALHAQVPDSIQHKYDSLLKTRYTKFDSASIRTNNKIDSAQLKLNKLLRMDFKTPDTRQVFAKRKVSDSITAVHDLDSIKGGLTHKIDSLKSLNLPTERYTRKLDSLNKLSPAKYLANAQSKVNRVEDKINRPIDNLEQKINKPIDNVEGKVNDKLGAINKEGGNTGLPGNVDLNQKLDLPNPNVNNSLKTDSNLKIPGAEINVDNPLSEIENPIGDELGKAGEVKDKFNNLKQAPKEKLDNLKSVDEVKTVQEKAGKLNEVTDKTQGYQQDVKNVANGNLGEVKALPDALESKAKGLDELKELEKQKGQGLGEMEKYKDLAGNANNPEALKEEAKKQTLTYAKNHFAGKEKALQAGMDQLSKLKQKYPDMPTPEQMKKRVYNAMHGKPLIERLVPGVTLQVQKSTNVMIDFNPVLSYRISGVWNVGLGWNERFSFRKWNQLASVDRIYGPRAFTSVVIARGFGVKIEGERMNTFVPANAVTVDVSGRQWVWSVFVGIKKDYTISKSVRGNIQTLYNLYDDHDNSPYADRLVVRMGIEIPMKKAHK